MSGSELMIAALLLLSPPGTPYIPIAESDWPALQGAIHQLAIDWEILDAREIKYILTQQKDFESDINLLRKRYQELKNAPRISDCKRFPDRSTVNELLNFNRTFRKNLEMKIIMEQDRAVDYRQAIKETDRCYQIWDSVRDARCDFYYVTVRRQAMKKLKDMIGDEAYYSANLPPFVPLWRFQELP